MFGSKKERIKKIFSKDFANWYIDNYEYLRENPEKLWKKLAQVLRSPMNKKTIVFSMKAFDIANLICYGDYLPFPQNIPIPVDFHVKHVTISSGLLNQYYDDELFRNVWSLVLNKVKYNLDRNITLLRLDSIVWQIGKLLYKCGYKRELSQKSVEEYLTRKICIEKNLAKEIATELTRFIDNV
ncbi:MAG: N-glycosylase/DNA lyase [Candidatus Bathyarchaeia archaeon]